MKLVCPYDEEHEGFDVDVEDSDTHLVDRSGDYIKTYGGSRTTDWAHVRCNDCDTLAVDMEDMPMQTISLGAPCPFCTCQAEVDECDAIGTVIEMDGGARCSDDECHFRVEKSDELTASLLIGPRGGLRAALGQLQKLGQSREEILEWINREMSGGKDGRQ